MWQIGILCLCLFWVGLSETDVKLRVSIRRDVLQEVPSSIQSFSQVELLNLDPHDSIVIESIEMGPETTYLVKNGETFKTTEVLPQQLHLSSLPSGSLSLGANQIAIIPLSFIPRYPQQQPSIEGGSSESSLLNDDSQISPPSLSNAVQADLEQLVGHENLDSMARKPRNNLGIGFSGDLYEVHGTVILETSRGPVRMQFVTSSVRRNPYRVPEVIRFRPPLSDEAAIRNLVLQRETARKTKPISREVVILDVENVDRERGDPGDRKSQVQAEEPKDDCYDLYMSNPSDENSLSVIEVQVSRPDLAGVYYDSNPATATETPKTLRQVVLGWDGDSFPLSLKARSKDVYIVSICPQPSVLEIYEGLDNDVGLWLNTNDPHMNLGHLTIRTDKDTIFVGLQSLVNDEEKSVEQASLPSALPGISDRNQLPDEIRSFLDDSVSPGEPRFQLINKTKHAMTRPNAVVGSSRDALVADPPNIDVDMMTLTGRESHTLIRVRSSSTVPIRTMRASVRIMASNKDFPEFIKALGLDINVTVRDPHDAFCGENGSCVGGEGERDSVNGKEIALNCLLSSSQADNFFSNHPKTKAVRVMGHIVVRASAQLDKNYDEWIDTMKLDPFEENNLTIEIPFSVTIVDGRLAFVVDDATDVPSEWRLESPLKGNENVLSLQGLFFPASANQGVNSVYSENISYELRLVSLGGLPLRIERVDISGTEDQPICRRFSATFADSVACGKETLHSCDIGSISLAYDTGAKGQQNNLISMTIECRLTISFSTRTIPNQNISLRVFPGLLSVSTSEIPALDSSSNHEHVDFSVHLIDGIENLASWLDSSAVGSALKRYIRSFGSRSDGSGQLLGKYLDGMIDRRSTIVRRATRPLLLNVGSIRFDRIKTIPLYIRNNNPIPITVSVNTGEVEGMSVAIGRDETRGKHEGRRLLDYLPSVDESIVAEGDWQGHSTEGLRQFLLENEYGGITLARLLPYRDAVKFDRTMSGDNTLMRNLFQRHAVAGFHEDPFPFHLYNATIACPDPGHHPPLFVTQEPHPVNGNAAPVIISEDFGLRQYVMDCRDTEAADGKVVDRHPNVTVPPGGVARFEVRVRPPPVDFLNQDITPIVTTGLVLSTDQGEALPIIAAYDTVWGGLILSANDQGGKTDEQMLDEEEIVEVPVTLFAESSIGERPRKGLDAGRVTLNYASVSFEDTVMIRDVDSCNPWFQISVSDAGAADMNFEGTIRTAVSCDFFQDTANGLVQRSHGDIPRFPSFFECALTWMRKRPVLQPRSCGAEPPYDGFVVERFDDDEDAVEEDVIGIAVSSFSAAVARSSKQRDRYWTEEKGRSGDLNIDDSQSRKTGRKRSSGYVDPSSLRVFADAAASWDTISDLGLDLISSSLRATIDLYEESIPGSIQRVKERVNVTIDDLQVQSRLQVPLLFDEERSRGHGVETDDRTSPSILEFPLTRVADVEALMVPIRNPTGAPVRVMLTSVLSLNRDLNHTATEKRLATDDLDSAAVEKFLSGRSGVHVQTGGSPGIGSLWWEGDGAFFLPDDRGHLIQANYVKSPMAGRGASLNYLLPDLSGSTAFLAGCTTRCGILDESETFRTRLSTKESPIGASSASSKGQSHPSGNPDVPELASPFAIPFSALDEIILPAFSTAELGPILFRPPRQFESRGCANGRCDSRPFESVILIENSLTGLERLVVRGRGVWEEVAFLDPIDDAVKYDSPSGVDYRKGFSTLLFPGTSASHQGSEPSAAVIREVIVHNPGELAVRFETVYFSQSRERTERFSATNAEQDKQPRQHAGCSMHKFWLRDCNDHSSLPETNRLTDDEVNLRHGFALEPGHNRSIFVQHFPDCTRQSQYVALTFVYTNRKSRDYSADLFVPFFDAGRSTLNPSPFSPRHRDLMIGFDMTDAEFAACVPSDTRRQFSRTTSSLTEEPENITSSPWFEEVKGESAAVSLVVLSSSLFGFVASMFVLLSSVSWLGCERDGRQKASFNFQWRLQGPKKKARFNYHEKGAADDTSVTPSHYNHWPAAFRCLARADPSAPELQALGREQARQVVSQRYKEEGMLSPQCITSTGVFLRDRNSFFTGAQRSSKNGSSGGNEKVVTLSDAMFGGASSDGSLDGLVSCNLGWRAARSRGIVSKRPTVRARSLKSVDLLEQRDRLAEETRNRGVLQERIEDKEAPFEDDDAATSAGGEQKSVVALEANNRAPATSDDADDNEDVVSTSESEETVQTSSKEDETPASVESPEVSKSKILLAVQSPASSVSSASSKANKKHQGDTKKQEPYRSGTANDHRREEESTGSREDSVSTAIRMAATTISTTNETKGHKGHSEAQQEATELGKEKKHFVQNKPVSKKGTEEDMAKHASTKQRFKPLKIREESSPLTEAGRRVVSEHTTAKEAKSSPKKQKAERRKRPEPKSSVLTASKTQTAKPVASTVPARSASSSLTALPDSDEQRSTSSLSKTKLDQSRSRGEDKPAETSSSRIRPPPGLAPPPGLSSVEAEKVTSSEDTSHQMKRQEPTLPPLPFLMNAALPAVSSPPLGTTAPALSSPHVLPGTEAYASVTSLSEHTIPFLPASPRTNASTAGAQQSNAEVRDSEPLSPPVLGTGDGFNVLDFLDSILEDHTASRQEGPAELVTETTSSSLPSVLPLFSNDPWAAERKSRALAYGISVEESGNDGPSDDIVDAMFASVSSHSVNDTDNEQSLSHNVPLLTPAVILGVTGRSEDDDKKSGSFYASLLRE